MLVWTSECRPGVSAAMSSVQFVHSNAPVVSVQQNGRMEYFGSEEHLGWVSNLPWPRAILEMARLPACPDLLNENSTEGGPPKNKKPE